LIQPRQRIGSHLDGVSCFDGGEASPMKSENSSFTEHHVTMSMTTVCDEFCSIYFEISEFISSKYLERTLADIIYMVKNSDIL
jgi:hypothetical protein